MTTLNEALDRYVADVLPQHGARTQRDYRRHIEVLRRQFGEFDLDSIEPRDVGIFATVPDGYITGLGRDYPHPKLAHLYKGDFSNPGLPMCRKGWNRDDGRSWSIWRGNIGENGICKVCMRRARAGKDGFPSREGGK